MSAHNQYKTNIFLKILQALKQFRTTILLAGGWRLSKLFGIHREKMSSSLEAWNILEGYHYHQLDLIWMS